MKAYEIRRGDLINNSNWWLNPRYSCVIDIIDYYEYYIIKTEDGRVRTYRHDERIDAVAMNRIGECNG